MERSQIHPQLRADCHYLGSLSASEVLLNRNATVPWFILVPDTHLADLLDLPREHRDQVMADCAGISSFIKQMLGFSKVNFAGLGNLVPQMHLHIIGRSEDDPCWPNPVWGQLPDGPLYEHLLLQGWQADLAKMLDLAPVDLSL